jgi:hypothetical protein
MEDYAVFILEISIPGAGHLGLCVADVRWLQIKPFLCRDIQSKPMEYFPYHAAGKPHDIENE